MHIFLRVFLIVLFLTAIDSKGEQNNIFVQNKGVNTQPSCGLPDNCDINSRQEFLPYSKVIAASSKLLTFRIPQDKTNQKYCYTGFGPFSIKRLTVYRLSLRLNNLYGKNNVFLYVSFFKGKEFISSQRMFIIAGAKNAPAAMTGYFRDFASPPDADKMILWIALSGGGKRLKTGLKLLLTDIKIIPVKRIKAITKAINLIKTGSNYINSGRGNNKLKIDFTDKGMRITKSRQKQYPWFNIRIPDGNSYYGKLVKFSCRVKGKGTIRPGIWWQKHNKKFEYINSAPILLSDKWENIECILYCDDPATVGASVALCMGNSLINILLEDISFVILGRSE